MDPKGGMENTYVLEPKDEERFYPSKIKKVIETILNDKLKNEDYDPNTAPSLCEDLSKIIRMKTREIKMPRYKFVVQVVLGQMKGQGLRVTSKCLWDPNFDNYASYTFTNEKLWCTGMVFGCYYE